MLSYRSYVSKCVIGMEFVYFICLIGGFFTFRTTVGEELHRRLLETLPGFTWITAPSIIWGGIIIAISSVIFGIYMVWMHNSSLVK